MAVFIIVVAVVVISVIPTGISTLRVLLMIKFMHVFQMNMVTLMEEILYTGIPARIIIRSPVLGYGGGFYAQSVRRNGETTYDNNAYLDSYGIPSEYF